MVAMKTLKDILVIFTVTLLLWNYDASVWAQTSNILDTEWHPNGVLTVSLSQEGVLNIYNTENQTSVFSYQYTVVPDLRFGQVAWNSDGTRLAVGVERYVYIWDTSNLLSPVSLHTLVAGSNDGLVIMENGNALTEAIYALEWSPNNQLLFTESLIPIIKIWSTSNFQEIVNNEYYSVVPVVWSNDSSFVTTGKTTIDANTGSLNILDGQTLPNNIDQGGVKTAVTISPDGNFVMYGTFSGRVVIVDSTNGNQVDFFDAHTDKIESLQWNPNGQFVASTDSTGILNIWDMSTLQIISTLQSPYIIKTIDWSPDGTQLAYGGENGVVEIIEAPISCDHSIIAGDVSGLVSAVNSANADPDATTICDED